MKQIIKRHWRFLTLASLSITLASVASVYVQFIKGDVLDSALARSNDATLRNGILLLVLIALEIGLYYTYNILSSKYFLSCARSLREGFFSSLLTRSYPTFSRRTQGDYMAVYTDQLRLIQKQYFENILWMVEISVKALLVSTALFLLDWRLALMTIFLLTTPLYVPKIVEKKLQKAQDESSKAFEKHLSKLLDWLKGFELIKNYTIEAKILGRFRRSNAELYAIDYRRQVLSYQTQIITTALSYFSHFIILVFAAWLVLRGEFSAGQFFIAVGMIDQLTFPFLALSMYLREIIAIKPVRLEVEALLMPSTTKQGTVKLKPGEVNKIDMQNVHFGYTPEKQILSGFNLHVEGQEKVLLRGPNGSGKSTSMSLLLNYYSPEAGKVAINDVAVDDIANLGELITVMRQDAVFFEDSLRENLSMYQEMQEDQLIQALNRVGLSEWANADSLAMPIQAGGANLSGGQRRRLALARSLLRQTPILVLDEPLANLDQESVKRVEEEILSIHDRMVILITHQFNPAKLGQFDKVVSFE